MGTYFAKFSFPHEIIELFHGCCIIFQQAFVAYLRHEIIEQARWSVGTCERNDNTQHMRKTTRLMHKVFRDTQDMKGMTLEVCPLCYNCIIMAITNRGSHERQSYIAAISHEINVTKPFFAIVCQQHIVELTVAH